MEIGTDFWLSDLFFHIFHNVSTSAAPRAFITSLTEIEHYTRATQFNKHSSVSVMSLANAISPGVPFGWGRQGLPPPRRLGSVLVVVAIHLTILAVVAVRFLAQTAISGIGDAWQALEPGRTVVLAQGASHVEAGRGAVERCPRTTRNYEVRTTALTRSREDTDERDLASDILVSF